MQLHVKSALFLLQIKTCCFSFTGSLNEDGSQKHFDREYVLMFGVFDENKSWQKSASVKYTINGYTDGTLPGTVQAYVKLN